MRSYVWLVIGICAAAGGAEIHPPVPDHYAQQQMTALSRYDWKLQEAFSATGRRLDVYFPLSERPLELSLTATGYLSAYGGCNTTSQGYELGDGRFRRSQWVLGTRTLLGCNEDRYLQDEAVSKYFEGDLHYTFSAGAHARLELESDQGDRLIFAGKLSPEARFGSKGEWVFLNVAAGTFPCVPQESSASWCLRAQELKLESGNMKILSRGEWLTLRSGIEGFAPRVEDTEVSTRRFPVGGPGARATDYAYILAGIQVGEGWIDAWEWHTGRYPRPMEEETQ